MNKDQKVALGVAGIGGGGILLWRHFHSSGSSGTTVTSTPAYGQLAPYTPQSPITLQPGETVYDPNSGALLNTPTAPTAGGPLPTPVPPQATAPSAPAYTVNVNYPKPTATKKITTKPAKRKVTPKHARVRKVKKTHGKVVTK